MPKKKNPMGFTKLPSVVLNERGLHQDGSYSVDKEGMECDWDEDAAVQVCMLGAVFVGFELQSMDFGNRVEEMLDVKDAVKDMSPGAMRYISMLEEAIRDKMEGMGSVEIDEDEDVMELVTFFSDGLEDAGIAYQVLVECEVMLDLRPDTDLVALVTK